MSLMVGSEAESKVKGLLERVEAHGVQMVDLRFTDVVGRWQHFSIPVEQLSAELFSEGLGFDGSSIRGFQGIEESDMILLPDAGTAFLDPACRIPTLSVIGDVYDPTSGTRYSRDPRFIAQKAEDYLKSTGIATKSVWGPEIEFFVFDDVRFHQDEHSAYYFVDSAEGAWNSGRDEQPNLGHKPRFKEGYFPVPPTDALQDFRSGAVRKMIEAGMRIETHHHEVGTAGQGEIDLGCTTLTKMADTVQMYKYILKTHAREQMKTVTFMPKPVFADNGSGMHCHQSLWNEETPLFSDPKGYAGISDLAKHYIGGLLKHGPALAAICAPTTNSYRRLVPGYEAPVLLAYSQRNRSACVRIPMYSQSPKSKRVEFRSPDPSANAYLAFAAMLLAGLDGVRNKLDPGQPADRDLFHGNGSHESIPTLPSSLDAALNALEQDHEFLLQGEVFTPDVIETWLRLKRTEEVDPVRIRPHPYEFHLYYDI